jgi:hypothetical protein
MFKRLAALEKSGGGLNVSFLNTHPASDNRVKVQHLYLFSVLISSLIVIMWLILMCEKQLEALLPEAFTVQATACGGTSDYMGGFGEAAGLGPGARTSWGR